MILRFDTVLLSCLLLWGCSPDAKNNDAGVRPPKAPRQAEQTSFVLARPILQPGETATIVDEYTGGTTTTHETGSATGAGAEARGDKLSDSVTGSAPAIGLGGGVSAMGGAFSREARVESLDRAMNNPLLWVGILGILGAGACFYFGLRRAATICGVVGGGMIAASMLPGWAWFILAVVGLVGLGVYVWAEHGGKRSYEALSAVAAGVADLKTIAPESYTLVKERVKAHANVKDNKTIDAVKAKDRL